MFLKAARVRIRKEMRRSLSKILHVTKTVDIKTEIKKPDIKLVGKIDLEKTLKPKVTKPEPPKPVEEKKVLKEAPEVKETEKKKTAEEKTKPPVSEDLGDKKAKSPIDIHIVGKIDLETVTRETKAPKKEDKPKEKPAEKVDSLKEEKKGTARKEKVTPEETSLRNKNS